MTLSCQVTCGKDKTHDSIVKIVKLQGNAPKKWGGGEYIPTDIGMAAAIPAIPPATPLCQSNGSPLIVQTSNRNCNIEGSSRSHCL